jgi:DNA-directed RNA polymerase subunit omega
MLHPSYSELIDAVNSNVEEGEEPVVNSRYSIVIASAKRARQIIAGEEPLIDCDPKKKPLSIAVDELYGGEVKILPEDDYEETTIVTPVQTSFVVDDGSEYAEDSEDEESDEDEDEEDKDTDDEEEEESEVEYYYNKESTDEDEDQ